jgi:hypothetical protein
VVVVNVQGERRLVEELHALITDALEIRRVHANKAVHILRQGRGDALHLTAALQEGEAARRAIETFSYTKTYRRTLRKVQFLNRLPVAWRQPLLNFYNRMAWLIAKKGL